MYEDLPKTRKEAKLKNLKHYFTGAPCNRGHISRRRTKDGWCIQCNYENSKAFRKCEKGKKYFENYEKKPEEAILSNCKQRAKNLNVPFDLTIEDIQIPEVCPIFGIKLFRSKQYKSNHSPSVDRIIPEKGYTKNNICIISDKANRLKSNMSLDELEKLIAYIEKHLNESNLC